MFCGDSVPSIVGEVGTKWAKFGFSGEDKPSVVSRSVRAALAGRPAACVRACV